MDISKLSYTEKEQLAKNPNTPVEVLAALAKDDDYYVRCGVARNANTPVGTLAELAKDEATVVRMWVASNPNTPVGSLMVLAKDEDYGVRWSVAENPNTPVEELAAVLSVELRGNWRKDTLRLVFNHRNSTDTIKAIIKTVFPGVQ